MTLSNPLFLLFSADLQTLMAQWIVNDGAGKFVCMKCGAKFNYKHHTQRHFKNKHVQQQPASCHVCHKEFRNEEYRDLHRSQVHGITKKMMKAAGNLPEYQGGLY